MTTIAAGLIQMELSRGDGSLGVLLGVQAGLAMRSIATFGSEEHKQRWLPRMTRMESLGAFALTEPDHGSDSVSLETTARRDGEDYVIDGGQAVDREWLGRRRDRGVGARQRRRAGQGLSGRAWGARIRGTRDRGQGQRALGHAVGAYDAALSYCRDRRQFGKPLISFQIV
jgi:glutaryl-CoA dehydrogenase